MTITKVEAVIPEYITTDEAAQRLHVATMTIRRWVAEGRLAGGKVGKMIIVDRAAVYRLASLRRAAAPSQEETE